MFQACRFPGAEAEPTMEKLLTGCSPGLAHRTHEFIYSAQNQLSKCGTIQMGGALTHQSLIKKMPPTGPQAKLMEAVP